MYILGISCYYHDAAACIIKDGKIVAAAEEERFTRKKHDSSFPVHAIRFCLQEAGINAGQLDHISYYEKPVLKFQRMLNQHFQMAPHSFRVFKESLLSWTGKMNVEKKIRELKYTGKITCMEHHESHAASAFLPSPFEEAAIVTVDGVGEWATTTIGIGKGNTVKILKEIHFPHSLGLLYSTMTAYLGFTVNNSEYKVMGLSAYGNPKTYARHVEKLISMNDDGSFSLDMSCFDFHYKPWMPSRKLCRLFGGNPRKADEPVTQRHKDIAAALQQKTEEMLMAIIKHARKETGMQNLCLAGGVALNSVANGKILKKSGFKDVWIQPAAGDSGNAIGAALQLYHTLGGKKRSCQETAYLGPEFSDAQIKVFLDSHFVKYTHFTTKNALVKKVARLIYENNVVGWFQGRMEWGPRALGARSILSNPCNQKMQDILNLKVKHREKFRPFAPAVCADDAQTYFECDEPIPLPTDFMLMVYPIREEWRAKIPAVTHVDGSGRLQTVRRKQNPLYYELIKEFGRLSGIPILINTSFNIRGEPIVCSPKDAYWCMMGTGIDYLVMGTYLIKRADNPEDMWDSEVVAGD